MQATKIFLSSFLHFISVNQLSSLATSEYIPPIVGKKYCRPLHSEEDLRAKALNIRSLGLISLFLGAEHLCMLSGFHCRFIKQLLRSPQNGLNHASASHRRRLVCSHRRKLKWKPRPAIPASDITNIACRGSNCSEGPTLIFSPSKLAAVCYDSILALAGAISMVFPKSRITKEDNTKAVAILLPTLSLARASPSFLHFC